MTDRNRVEIVCIVDRSGSMEAIRDDAQGGLNTFINDQKKLKKDVRLTLVQFDTEYEVLSENVPIKCAEPYTLEPRGGTALLDAIGRTINRVGARLAGIKENQRPARVIFMIVTDGQENSSAEFTRNHVFQMISHQRKYYSWEFLFIAANQDAICEAQNIGIPRHAAMNFCATPTGVRKAYRTTSDQLCKAIVCGDAISLPDSVMDDENDVKPARKSKSRPKATSSTSV